MLDFLIMRGGGGYTIHCLKLKCAIIYLQNRLVQNMGVAHLGFSPRMLYL